MQTEADWKPAERVQVLVFGRSKSGKTAGAGTFPRPCFMDFDGGLAVLHNPQIIAKLGPPHYIKQSFAETSFGKSGIVSKATAFDEAYLYYHEMMKPENVGKFDTWVIDSGTRLSEYAMNKGVIFNSMKKLSATFDDAVGQGVMSPRQQDYGSERSLVEQFVAMVQSSGKHFVLLCHEKELQDKAGNVTGVVPLLTGRGVEAISLMFDEIYRLEVKPEGSQMKRVLRTEQDAIIKCGSRYGVPNGTEWSWPALQKALKLPAFSDLPEG